MSAIVAAGIVLLLGVVPAPAQLVGGHRLKDLSLTELASLEVTSVSRRAEPLAAAPASIFVITADDVRRAGATTLAEALRLAPNLQIARIDAGQYAITARGFNGLAANKLLVLVDGRTIYTPLFSGVFWDQQDVLLEDLDRIEVISGPGATLWGANAVNGVINIITRSAEESQGALASVGGGHRQQGAVFRYGSPLWRGGHGRVYGKVTHFENNQRADVTPTLTGRNWVQAGFRGDWGQAPAGVSVQGNAYVVQSVDRGIASGIAIGRAELSGLNGQARWRRAFGKTSSLQLQAYVDHAERNEQVLFQPESDLYDVELQHSFSVQRHRFVLGAGYRHGTDDVADGFLVGFRPKHRVQDWSNVYIQDEIRVNARLELTAGIRLDRNDYTGWEYQPDARIAWLIAPQHRLWGGVARAVRAPARFDRDVIRPLGGVFGGPNFVAEVANVFQVGYRAQPVEALTWSVAVFRHQWDRLRSSTGPPVFFENAIEGPVYGLEGWGAWQIVPAWRVSGGATTFRKDLRLQPGSTNVLGPSLAALGNDPGQQGLLRSSLNVLDNQDLDLIVRVVGELPNPRVPGYTAVDLRYGWRVRPNIEVSLLGQNLFDASHPEFNALPGRSEFARSLFVQATWAR